MDKGPRNGRRLSQAEDGRRGSCGKKALRRQLFIVGYLQFVDRKHLQAALCSTRCRASPVARKLHSWMSKSGITKPVKASENFEGDGSVI